VLSWHAAELVRDVKESTCRVLDAPIDDGTLQQQLAAVCASGGSGGGGGGAGGGAAVADVAGSAFSPASYTLPDGNVVVVGRERVLVPEMLFSSGVKTASGMMLQQSLQDTLLACSMGCEMDARRDLVGNMVVTGGVSRIQGLYERLIRDFLPIAPPGTRGRFVAGLGEERSLGPWLGGSILGSLGTFHDMWFSASEFSEHGVKYVHRKCP
jgi:actin-related protein